MIEYTKKEANKHISRILREAEVQDILITERGMGVILLSKYVQGGKKVRTTEDKVRTTEDKVRTTEDKVRTTEDKVRTEDEKVATFLEKVTTDDRPFRSFPKPG